MSFDPDAPATGDGLYGLDCTPAEAGVVVLPVPWQATTSFRRGTRGGPEAVRIASMQVDLEDLDVGAAWEKGIALSPLEVPIEGWDLEVEADALAVIGSGGEMPEAAARVNERSEAVNDAVYRAARDVLAAGRIPAVLGGDHSVPYGAIQAVIERFPGVGVLHIDAHADLRAAYEGFTWSHASIFYNVLTRLPLARLVQVGLRDVGSGELTFQRTQGPRVVPFFDNALARRLAEGEPWMAIVRDIVTALPDEVYVSFDVDGMDPSWCPNTGTPVPGGISYRDVVLLLGEVGRTRRIVGFDINEVGDDPWDANVAARLLYKLAGWAR